MPCGPTRQFPFRYDDGAVEWPENVVPLCGFGAGHSHGLTCVQSRLIANQFPESNA